MQHFCSCWAAVRITDETQKRLVDRPGSWKVLAGGIPGICHENCQSFQDARDMWEPQTCTIGGAKWLVAAERKCFNVSSPDCAASFGKTYSRVITLLAAQCFPDEFFQSEDEVQRDESEGQLGPQPVIAAAKPCIDKAGCMEIKVGDSEVTKKSSNRELRNACNTWSCATSGDKKKLWRRLLAHSLVVYNESALEVAEKLYAEQGREPVTLRKPANVSSEDLVKHELTHHPSLSSCEACVRARSREDNHPDVETKPEATACRDGGVVFSMDYGFWGIASFLRRVIQSMVAFWECCLRKGPQRGEVHDRGDCAAQHGVCR